MKLYKGKNEEEEELDYRLRVENKDFHAGDVL